HRLPIRQDCRVTPRAGTRRATAASTDRHAGKGANLVPRLRYSLTGALAALSLSGLAALAYSAWFEPRRLAVHRYVLTVPDLPPALMGLRAAFLSDFHVGGSRLSDRVLRRAIRTVVAAHPDLVFLGGDFYDRANMHDGGRIFAPLKALSGRMFAVLGNHDFRRGSTS